MKGTLVWKDHQWKINGGGKDLPLDVNDRAYKGQPLKDGMEVDFDVISVEKRELRDFAGSFKVTTEQRAKLK